MTAYAKYDVYGGVRSRTGTATSAHGFVGQLGHTSEAETGLIYMRARYMDPVIGRFVSEDPAFSGSNFYAYCAGNPITSIDADGRRPTTEDLWNDLGNALMAFGWTLARGGLRAAEGAAAGMISAISRGLAGSAALPGILAPIGMALGRIGEAVEAFAEKTAVQRVLFGAAMMALGQMIIALGDDWDWSRALPNGLGMLAFGEIITQGVGKGGSGGGAESG